MTGQAIDHQYAEFDPRSAEECRLLIEMYQGYCLEELERTGEVGLGFPVAFYLKTFIVWCDGEIAGFCSLDPKRCSAELIYLDPKYRGLGIARTLFTELKASCPKPMEAKAPLSPAGQALVDSVGIGVAEPEGDQVRDAARARESLHRMLDKHCPHKRSNPARPCPRCYRKAAKQSAAVVIGSYVAARWAMAAKTATPANGGAA